MISQIVSYQQTPNQEKSCFCFLANLIRKVLYRMGSFYLNTIIFTGYRRIWFFPFKYRQGNACENGLNSIPAVSLGFIKTQVCPSNQRFGQIAPLVGCDAKTCRDFAHRCKVEVSQSVTQSFRQFNGLLPIGIGGQAQKLVAPPSPERIGGTDGLPHVLGNFQQDFITGIMPEGIVDIFKLIQVKK